MMNSSDFELNLNKLIILFMLDTINLPMTNSQISDILLEKSYTNYFSLQQSISELVDTGLLHTGEINHNTRYSITENGKQTLFYFSNRIPESIKEEILGFLKENKYKLRNEVEVTAEYIPEKNNDWTIHCVAKENETTLIEFKLNVVSKQQAIEMCENWKNNSHAIYSSILGELLKNRNED
ncbi:uncharacterized protein DUF4364 [Natranaerovirga pectinivora]|uniref:Uncharacterized protein DUF4364 n=1 Tax=Natranaerovirga pectinivora TaxID=682400 RepID=A0A4R3MQF4_9FIRM|nr:DUF4364 family protein [Natranaerovirga pectinivora]TCT14650.1 uncharacterized protein DUF4364 [Natranaerovirga pectinivora]